MRTLIREFFELINSIVMSIPVHLIRKMWVCSMTRCGKGCVFLPHIRFHNPHRIKIGKDVVINRNVMLDGRCRLEIHDSVDIGEYVCIWTLQHSVDDGTHSLQGKKVIIEDHVWIAPHSIILPGVKIGRGSVIATGAVVTKDIPPYSLAGGIPARVLRKLSEKIEYVNNYKAYL